MYPSVCGSFPFDYILNVISGLFWQHGGQGSKQTPITHYRPRCRCSVRIEGLEMTVFKYSCTATGPEDIHKPHLHLANRAITNINHFASHIGAYHPELLTLARDSLSQLPQPVRSQLSPPPPSPPPSTLSHLAHLRPSFLPFLLRPHLLPYFPPAPALPSPPRGFPFLPMSSMEEEGQGSPGKQMYRDTHPLVPSKQTARKTA